MSGVLIGQSAFADVGMGIETLLLVWLAIFISSSVYTKSFQNVSPLP